MRQTLDARVRRLVPDRVVLLWGGLLVCLEALAVLLFWQFARVTPLELGIYVYPFVWLNLGLWALVRTEPPAASRRKRYVAVAAAAAYFLVLAYAGGMVGPPHSHGPGVEHDHGLSLTVRIASIPPGWGPVVALEGSFGFVQLMPYQVVGYLALAYLLYVTVLDATTAAVSGVVGLFTCVGCSAPLLLALVSGVGGSAAGVAAVMYDQPYGIATLAFVVTVALLAWRPTLR